MEFNRNSLMEAWASSRFLVYMNGEKKVSTSPSLFSFRSMACLSLSLSISHDRSLLLSTRDQREMRRADYYSSILIGITVELCEEFENEKLYLYFSQSLSSLHCRMIICTRDCHDSNILIYQRSTMILPVVLSTFLIVSASAQDYSICDAYSVVRIF